MPGAASRIVVETGLAAPSSVSRATCKAAPAAALGHRKSTLVEEANRTAAASPLTRTRVPPRAKEAPLGSFHNESVAVSHWPSRLATEPGLQTRPASWEAPLTREVTSGLPEPTSRATSPEAAAPSASVAVKET